MGQSASQSLGQSAIQALGQSASQNVAADGSRRRLSGDVLASHIVYEGADGCLYSVTDPDDVAPKKRGDWPGHAEMTHTG